MAARPQSRTDRMLRDFMRHMESRGYVRRFYVGRRDYDLSWTVEAVLSTGERRGYALTEYEMHMDGERAFRHWLDTVERDIRGRCDRGRYDLARSDARRLLNPWADGMDPYYRAMQEAMRGPLIWEPKHNPAAEAKSKDLFILAAGKPAFDTLDSGKPLPMTGSAGTAYTLHKRASYCVERVSDKARLCAVVPGVPLWDHLLGIKLMVEHDEPKFLRTANVSSRQVWA